MFGLQDDCTHTPLHGAEAQGSALLESTHLPFGTPASCVPPSLSDKQRSRESSWVLPGFGLSLSTVDPAQPKPRLHDFLGNRGGTGAHGFG